MMSTKKKAMTKGEIEMAQTHEKLSASGEINNMYTETTHQTGGGFQTIEQHRQNVEETGMLIHG